MCLKDVEIGRRLVIGVMGVVGVLMLNSGDVLGSGERLFRRACTKVLSPSSLDWAETKLLSASSSASMILLSWRIFSGFQDFLVAIRSWLARFESRGVRSGI